MVFVTDKIGDEYKNWKPYDRVFISSYTGTGKTYFILNVLLKYVCEQRKKILYLVNRHILKEQLESEISKYSSEYLSSITIELYQTLENIMCISKYNNGIYTPLGYNGLNKFCNYDYIVCDECHYFLADSNYNTNTGLSFRWIQDMYSSKIRIFLSATIKDIKDYILLDDEKRRYVRTNYYGFRGKNVIRDYVINEVKEWKYDIPRNYDYFDVNIINKIDEIYNLVKEKDDKWLIFVDNISFGKQIHKELSIILKNVPDEEANKKVVMISSDYKKSNESAQEVDFIRKDNMQSAKVLISTSFMDNGINLKDISLRNIVLIADTEVEFIQMLGRKRLDGKRVNLYIIKQSKGHFSNRIWKIQKMGKIAIDYSQNAERIISPPILEALETNEIIDYNQLNNLEWKFIINQHKIIMNDIANHRIDFEDAEAVLNVYDGILYLNQLSFRQIENLIRYYNGILENFEIEGEDAFVKEQLRWLGKTDIEIDSIINESRISREERSREAVLDEFLKIKNNPMDKQNAVYFKNKVRDYLLVLVQAVDGNYDEKQKVIESLKKPDRPISKNIMQFLRDYCDIPFEIKVEKSSGTSISDGKKDSVYIVQDSLK